VAKNYTPSKNSKSIDNTVGAQARSQLLYNHHNEKMKKIAELTKKK